MQISDSKTNQKFEICSIPSNIKQDNLSCNKHLYCSTQKHFSYTNLQSSSQVNGDLQFHSVIISTKHKSSITLPIAFLCASFIVQ